MTQTAATKTRTLSDILSGPQLFHIVVNEVPFAIEDARDLLCQIYEAARVAEAAAPDLLAALKSLCDHDASYHNNEIRIACESHGDAIRRMRVAREAIAKAEARS